MIFWWKWNERKNKWKTSENLPFVKLKFGPSTIVCWSRSDSFWIALMEISLMAILFSSSDDCRWPKIQFKKPEKMFFVSREFSRFVNFAFLQHFCHYFHHIYCFFDGVFYFYHSNVKLYRDLARISFY